jgi:hypothetical protein
MLSYSSQLSCLLSRVEQGCVNIVPGYRVLSLSEISRLQVPNLHGSFAVNKSNIDIVVQESVLSIIYPSQQERDSEQPRLPMAAIKQ